MAYHLLIEWFPKNLYLNQNFSLTNSVILNKYSINNLIIFPSNINSNKKGPSFLNNSLQEDVRCSFSPVPKKLFYKNSNSIVKPINLIKNITPIVSIKNSKKFIELNLSKDSEGKNIIPVLNLYNLTKVEKNPEDSKKKLIKKNVKYNTIENDKLLKNSFSHREYNPARKTEQKRYAKYSEETGPRNSFFKKKRPLNSKSKYSEPKEILNLKEFSFMEQIGKGTYGKIFSAQWIKNNKLYAMKKEVLNEIEEVEIRRKNFKIIQKFIKETGCKGVINLYGNLCIKTDKNNEKISNNNIKIENNTKYFIYYELMEKAQRDWNKEIDMRNQYKLYYTEREILNIITQLIGTLSLLEKNHITHRDIKPQNILIVDGKYKLSDFGEIRILKRDGLIVQRIRGSELYMSPILFYGLHLNLIQVRHNTYKSDVFSLGMCLFYALSLTYEGVDTIREITDMKKIKEILFKYLGKRYSVKLIMFILSMLEVNESKRLNFIQLKEKLNKIFI